MKWVCFNNDRYFSKFVHGITTLIFVSVNKMFARISRAICGCRTLPRHTNHRRFLDRLANYKSAISRLRVACQYWIISSPEKRLSLRHPRTYQNLIDLSHCFPLRSDFKSISDSRFQTACGALSLSHISLK